MIKAGHRGLAFCLVVGCGQSQLPPGAAKPAASDAAEAGRTDPQAPVSAPVSAPEPDPEPEPGPEPVPPLVAPDGTAMKACGTTPPSMACIPGGPFLRGTVEGPANTRPQQSIWVQTFHLDLDEVTYAEYKACEAAAQCDVSGPKYEDFDGARQPISGVSWFEARKYCEAQGKRLPTEAEWEKAARGPDGEQYPWGDEPATCERAIIMDETGRSCGIPKLGESPEKGRPWEVGSRPAYRYGLRDMAGNSYEWVADWYSQSWDQCGKSCAGVNPMGPCGGKDECRGHIHRVVRGGSWYWPADRATGSHRRFHVPHNRPFHHFGFRCAQDLP